MKKKVSVLVIIMMVFLITPVFSDTKIKLLDYEPYGVNEFPQWSQKLRRGESLFFGSLAITMPLTIAGYNLAKNQNLFVATNDPTKEVLYQLSIAATFSLGITIVDYILGEI